MNMKEGYLLLGLGCQYIGDAIDLILTLRKNKDTRPVDILTGSAKEARYAESLRVFNRVMHIDVESDPLFGMCKTNFEKKCLLPRLRLEKYLNHEYTMLLDVDMLCAFPTDAAWDFLKKNNQPVSLLGAKENAKWHWGYWGEICGRLGTSPMETHGGLIFFNKNYSEKLSRIFGEAEYCFVNYSELGMKRFYEGGAVDEPCFSYSFSKNGLVPINFSDFPIMTFNHKGTSPLPTKAQTAALQEGTMSGFIPFIHMFEKNRGANFLTLKNRILSSGY